MLYCSMSTRVIVVEDATLKNRAKANLGSFRFAWADRGEHGRAGGK